MSQATVVVGTPLVQKLNGKDQSIAISAFATVGTVDITFTLDEANPINVAWTPGQLAQGSQGFEFFDFNITSFTVTSTGALGSCEVNWSVRNKGVY